MLKNSMLKHGTCNGVFDKWLKTLYVINFGRFSLIGNVVRIAVAEDDPAIREMLNMHLQCATDVISGRYMRENCYHNPLIPRIDVVGDGLSLVNLVLTQGHDLDDRPEGYCLIVTDVKMPGMDGITAVNQIRKQHPYLPVLVISANNTAKPPEGALFLPKPYELDDLIAGIENCIRSDRPCFSIPTPKAVYH